MSAYFTGQVVAFNGFKDMSQDSRRLGTIMPLRKISIEAAPSGNLQEIHQLMNFQKRDEGVQQAGEVPLHQSNQGSASRRHGWRFRGARTGFASAAGRGS